MRVTRNRLAFSKPFNQYLPTTISTPIGRPILTLPRACSAHFAANFIKTERAPSNECHHSGSNGRKGSPGSDGWAVGFDPGCETIRSASPIVIPGRMLLNRKSDPSAPSCQVPMRIPPSRPGRGTELTTSIRLRSAYRRSIWNGRT
jgi:hypothetical protein